MKHQYMRCRGDSPTNRIFDELNEIPGLVT
jgi:hypothetical protein